MTRPLFPGAVCFLLGIYLQLHTGFAAYFDSLLFWLTLLLLFLLLIPTRFRLTIFFSFAGLLCGMIVANVAITVYYQPAAMLEGKTSRITGIVTEFPEQYEDSQRVSLKISEWELPDISFPINTRVSLPLTVAPIEPGDKITADVGWYLPGISDGYDRLTLNRSENIFILASVVEDYQIEKATGHSFPYQIKAFGQQIKENIENALPEREAGFLTAVLTGDKSKLLRLDSNHLRRAGLSHVMAVSGLHIGFLIAVVLFCFGKRIGTFLSVPVIFLFVMMIGWSPSVVRAGIMYVMLAVAFWIDRESDSLTALGLAAALILLFRPFAIDSISFQLSFAATLGIILFAGRIQAKLSLPKKLPKVAGKVYAYFTASISCSLASFIFTAPILLYHFGYLSVLSFIANILTLWAVSFVFSLGMFASLLSFFFPAGADTLFALVRPLISWILMVSDWIASVPAGLIYAKYGSTFIAVIISSLLLALLFLLPRIFRPHFVFPALFLMLLCISYQQGRDRILNGRVTILPSGFGQTILVSKGEDVVLIDCSASGYRKSVQAVSDWLDWWGYDKIRLLLITSMDLSHARNVPELLETADVERVILPPVVKEKTPYPEILNAAKKHGIPIEHLSQDGQIGPDELGIYVEIINGNKLLVRLQNEDIFILHALTLKMLNEWLDEKPVQAATVVVGQYAMADIYALKKALSILKPNSIILESNLESASKLFGIPVTNILLTGEVELNREGGKQNAIQKDKKRRITAQGRFNTG